LAISASRNAAAEGVRELAVAVKVGPVAASASDPLPFVPWMSRDADGSTIVQPASSQQQ